MIIHLEKRLYIAQHSRLIVHQQNFRSFGHYARTSESPVGGFIGIMKENLQPAPGSLSTQIFPPMPCTNRRAIASPNPMPSDFPFPENAETTTGKLRTSKR